MNPDAPPSSSSQSEAATTALDGVVRRAISGDPDTVAIEFGGRDYLWRDVARLAGELEDLLTRAGIVGTRSIGFIPRTQPVFAAALLSLLANRRNVTMIYGFQSQEAVATDISSLGLAAYVGGHDFWSEKTLAALPEGAIAIALPADMLDAAPVRLAGGSLDADRGASRGSGGGPTIELLTSGTTGPPKRQPTSYQTIYDGMIAGSVMDAGDAEVVARTPGLVQFPFSNISGISALLPYSVARRRVRMLEKFTVEDWLDFVRTHRPSTVILPPAGVRMLLDAGLAPDALEGVDYITIGMTALDHGAWRAFEDYFGVPILYSYGATEFAGAATAMTPALHEQFGAAKFGSVGRPWGDNQIRIVDQDHPERQLPPEAVGLVEVKVPFLGDGWMRTNDLGRIDADGFLFILGRVDGAISRGGFKILPGPIEAAIAAHPGVAAVSVVGVPDPRLGQVPVAIVEPARGKPGPTAQEVIGQVRDRLPSTNVPAAVYFVDALPRTTSMKIQISAVRALAEDLHGC